MEKGEARTGLSPSDLIRMDDFVKRIVFTAKSTEAPENE
jgi:hypothetical protein